MKAYLTKNDIERNIANLPILTFEVTDACNLKCKYCGYGEFYNDYDERKNTFLPFEYAKKILDYLVPYWQSSLNKSAQRRIYIGFYGGEPLMNVPLIEKIIEYINSNLSSKNLYFEYSMTSNAILLDKYMDFIVKNDFNLLISLDGDKYGNSCRVDHSGQDAFERIIHNVNALRKKYPDYFERKVDFNSVLHNRNSVEETHSFIKKQYNKEPSINELSDSGIRADKKELFESTYRNYMESLYSAENYTALQKEMFIKSGTYQSVCTFLHQYSGFVFKDYTDLIYAKNTKSIPAGTCMPFTKKMFITVTGKILPCERIGQQYSLGTIDGNGICLDLQSVADKYNAYYAKLEKQCAVCHQKKACVQCLFQLEDLEEKAICYGCMNKKDFDDYVNTQMAFIAQNPEEYYRIMEEVIVE
ncbi:radical SAM peptide maturase [Bacteroidia bacterium]|nr:radical SAM peptide maturase [Bacteroidia bacterium]